MWDLIPGDLFILVHNGLYRYVSRGTGYRGTLVVRCADNHDVRRYPSRLRLADVSSWA